MPIDPGVRVPRLLPPVLPAGTFRDQPQPTLGTDRGFLLRRWRTGDESALVSAYDDPAIRHWHHRTMDTDWIAATSKRWNDEPDAEWAVTRHGEVMGRVALRGVDLSVGQAEVSYWTCPPARRPAARVPPRQRSVVSRSGRWSPSGSGDWRSDTP